MPTSRQLPLNSPRCSKPLIDHLADQNRSENLDRRRIQLGAAIAVVRLADADQSDVGVNLDEGRAAVSATPAQKRIIGAGPSQQHGFHSNDFHDCL